MPDGFCKMCIRDSSISKVNGETVNAKLLKELSGVLIDIHGQHDSQQLLQSKKHLEILDDFAGEEITSIKKEIKEKYHIYRKLQEQLKETNLEEREKERELSLARFELEEIESASLKKGEDEELENSYRTQKRAMAIGELKSYLQHNFARDDWFYTSNNERFRRNLYDVYLGGLDIEKFPRLFKRAIQMCIRDRSQHAAPGSFLFSGYIQEVCGCFRRRFKMCIRDRYHRRGSGKQRSLPWRQGRKGRKGKELCADAGYRD